MRKLWTTLMAAAALAGTLLGAGRAEAANCNPTSCSGLTCTGCNNFCTTDNEGACELAKMQKKLANVDVDQYGNVVIHGVNVFITDGTTRAVLKRFVLIAEEKS